MLNFSVVLKVRKSFLRETKLRIPHRSDCLGFSLISALAPPQYWLSDWYSIRINSSLFLGLPSSKNCNNQCYQPVQHMLPWLSIFLILCGSLPLLFPHWQGDKCADQKFFLQGNKKRKAVIWWEQGYSNTPLPPPHTHTHTLPPPTANMQLNARSLNNTDELSRQCFCYIQEWVCGQVQ